MNKNGAGSFTQKDGLRILVQDHLLRNGAKIEQAQLRWFKADRGTLTYESKLSPLGHRTIEVSVVEIRNPGGKRVLVHGFVGGVKSTVVAFRD